jgi:hypothetical protein
VMTRVPELSDEVGASNIAAATVGESNIAAATHTTAANPSFDLICEPPLS